MKPNLRISIKDYPGRLMACGFPGTGCAFHCTVNSRLDVVTRPGNRFVVYRLVEPDDTNVACTLVAAASGKISFQMGGASTPQRAVVSTAG